MTAEDHTTAKPPHASRRRWGVLARRASRRVLRPYVRARARQARITHTVARLEADLEHVRERHTEQIERLEDLVRELVLTAESLRREIAARTPGGEQ